MWLYHEEHKQSLPDHQCSVKVMMLGTWSYMARKTVYFIMKRLIVSLSAISNCSSTSKKKNSWSCIWWCWYICTASSFLLEMAMWRLPCINKMDVWSTSMQQLLSQDRNAYNCLLFMLWQDVTQWTFPMTKGNLLCLPFWMNHQTELDMMGDVEAEMLLCYASPRHTSSCLYCTRRICPRASWMNIDTQCFQRKRFVH